VPLADYKILTTISILSINVSPKFSNDARFACPFSLSDINVRLFLALLSFSSSFLPSYHYLTSPIPLFRSRLVFIQKLGLPGLGVGTSSTSTLSSTGGLSDLLG
jgi:hypothetical protein